MRFSPQHGSVLDVYHWSAFSLDERRVLTTSNLDIDGERSLVFRDLRDRHGIDGMCLG